VLGELNSATEQKRHFRIHKVFTAGVRLTGWDLLYFSFQYGTICNIPLSVSGGRQSPTETLRIRYVVYVFYCTMESTNDISPGSHAILLLLLHYEMTHKWKLP
jgi:hypothetical protein